MSKKHAYLIMAHNNFYCLEKLLMLLDDARNDIFLHIDAKVKNFDFAKFQSLCTRANVIYPEKRINVQWGTQSQVKTEMLLFETASACGLYHYYHLISGADLPLKTQDEIHAFFAKEENSYLFYEEITSQWNYFRVSRFNILVGKDGPIWGRIKAYLHLAQDKLSIDRVKNTGLQIKKGSNWCSVNQDAVNILLANRREILKLTRFSICADEIYKQTFLLYYGHPVVNNDLRRVNFQGGSHPQIYRTEDFDMLLQSGRLFARKFDENVDKEIIDMIFRHIMQKESILD